MIDKAKLPICVTYHCRDRVQQRFRLLLTPLELRDIESTVRNMVLKGKTNWKKIHSPFYRNKVESQHGVGSFFVENGVWVFACKVTNGKIHVRTVWRKRNDC